MKTLFTSLLLTVAFSTTYSQNNQSVSADVNVSNLKATVQNNNLMVNWVIAKTDNADYCEVQASNDGKNFSTIGLVLGADPKQANNFSFKQGVNKMKAGQVFYRVVSKGIDGKLHTSDIVKAAI